MNDVKLLEPDGAPAAWMVIGGQEQLVAFDISGGVINGIYGVLKPRQARLRRPLTNNPLLAVRRARRSGGESKRAQQLRILPVPGGGTSPVPWPKAA